MANTRSSMWGDWRALNLYGLPWFFDAPDGDFSGARPLLSTDLRADALDAAADPSVQGGAISKVAIFAGGGSGYQYGELGLNGYMAQIAVPDFVINKQREFRLADWSGARDDAMGDGSDRHAILIENVIVAAAQASQIGTPLLTLARMGLSVKFRGYGAPVGGEETEDTPVGPAFIFSSGTTAFPDMVLPGDAGGFNAAVDFTAGDDALVARIQHLIEIPNTISIGDVLEIIAALELPQETATGFGVQWYGAKYKWVQPPYPLDPNTGAQLLTADDEGQPRTDEVPFEP
jgi:hypothetical protein